MCSNCSGDYEYGEGPELAIPVPDLPLPRDPFEWLARQRSLYGETYQNWIERLQFEIAEGK